MEAHVKFPSDGMNVSHSLTPLDELDQILTHL